MGISLYSRWRNGRAKSNLNGQFLEPPPVQLPYHFTLVSIIHAPRSSGIMRSCQGCPCKSPPRKSVICLRSGTRQAQSRPSKQSSARLPSSGSGTVPPSVHLRLRVRECGVELLLLGPLSSFGTTFCRIPHLSPDPARSSLVNVNDTRRR